MDRETDQRIDRHIGQEIGQEIDAAAAEAVGMSACRLERIAPALQAYVTGVRWRAS